MVLMHPADLSAIGASDGERLRMGNDRGELTIHAQAFDGIHQGSSSSRAYGPIMPLKTALASTFLPVRMQ